MRLVRLLLLATSLALLSCAGTVLGSHQRTIHTASTGKSLVVYRDASFEVDGRRLIELATIEHTMQATGFFSLDDVRELGPQLQQTLQLLQPRERAVIVGVGAIRPPRYHIAVQGNDLVVILYHGNNAMSRHASAIGHGGSGYVEAHPTTAPPAPVAAPQPAVAPHTPVVTTPKPTPTPARPAETPNKPTTKLTPEEVRDRLRRLQELKEQGLVEESDYQLKRKALIEQL